ncbi:Uncharacterised protein [Weissella viridescens]|uniref:Uncharacterized protein n=1 Tax=Weissella viridescens TaxID=1629 RepID=A0A380P838_WEIVI|nr:Uncharacterised protein [Weissella viridescens]
MTDKQLLKPVYVLVTFVGFAVFACMTIDKSSQASALYIQTQSNKTRLISNNAILVDWNKRIRRWLIRLKDGINMKYQVIARNKATGENEVLQSFMDHDQAANLQFRKLWKVSTHGWKR